MEQDNFTEITNQSWLSRIGGAIKGIFFGLILFLLAFPLLFWNEGRAVKRHKTLNEGEGVVISISNEHVDSANEGALVHISGLATTEKILNDPVFNVSEKAIKLLRSVEMYQWDEKQSSTTKKKLGGGKETKTTYSYKKVWESRVINSNNFKKTSGHENPNELPYKSKEFFADDVTLGAFQLPQSLISKITGFSPVNIDASAPLPVLSSRKIQRIETGYYIGEDMNNPEIGDMRVVFKVIKPANVSIVAQQVKDSFEPYKSSQGGSIELLSMGIVSKDAMFEKAQQGNNLTTWLIRLGGFILLFTGLSMAFSLLSVLADVIPLFGNIVAAGKNIIAFLTSGILSCITIAIAWIIYRPLIGIILLVVAILFGFIVSGKLRAVK